ncbi:[citrate (pro-3S)-lyase] ligase [Bacilli bacterium PM5-3]|nr:[citrate (pro-3S)-lyase] ligase [Bacilli bacterium PM5-3]MDH6603022.1 [citrate (pro-3S)-lyase] ligase [Bacilli bacterium PM5-9]
MVVNYNYKIKINREKLESFLKTQGLTFDENIDTCLVIKDNDKIVACAAKKDNVFKMIAVSCHFQSQDFVAKLISELVAISHSEGLFHYFIFTKMIYQNHFSSIGFNLLVQYEEIGLFEMGTPLFNQYYNDINIDSNNIGTIVMNCNPFTLGHRYLIATALKDVDFLIIFVVEENKSYFDFKTRIDLVKRGVEDLDNVLVIPSGPYIISEATFPTYFLKSLDSKAKYYTNIDILMFKKIMEKLNIKKRFVGSEPNDELTAYYNNELKANFGDELIVIERKKVDDIPISASLVRKYLAENDYDKIKPLVNEYTYNYLKGRDKSE